MKMFWESFIVWAEDLIIRFSYVAIFFLSVLGTSTLFIPFPLDVILSFAGSIGLNPLFLGIVVGMGSATGELTGYLVGAGGRMVIEEKKRRMPKIIKFFTNSFEKYGFGVIALTAFIPFPFDFIGILSGVSKYNIKKFYIAVALGRVTRALLFAYLGYLVIPVIGDWLEMV